MNIPILMYHQIEEPPPRGSPMRGLIVSPQSFKRQMILLKHLGYSGLSMRDLEPYLNGERQGKVVGITFDDGYRNNVINALPILNSQSFTATCYGVSSMIGGSNSWDECLGIAQKPLMDIDDWLRWRDAGMDIGSHTCTHEALTNISHEKAFEQITHSKEALENILNCEVRHFCYPYGWFNSKHQDVVKDAGYITATTTNRGLVHSDSDFFSLPRVMVARTTHLGLFALKLLTQYENNRT